MQTVIVNDEQHVFAIVEAEPGTVVTLVQGERIASPDEDIHAMRRAGYAQVDLPIDVLERMDAIGPPVAGTIAPQWAATDDALLASALLADRETMLLAELTAVISLRDIAPRARITRIRELVDVLDT